MTGEILEKGTKMEFELGLVMAVSAIIGGIVLAIYYACAFDAC